MFLKKLHISQIFSNLECPTFKFYILVMCNLYTKFLNFLEICKQFSNELINEKGNIVRRGSVPRFYDLEVVALSMAAEAEEITTYLNLHLQCIEIIHSINNQHILRLELLHLKNYALDLRREYVNTTNNEHIIASTHDATHLYGCTAT